MVPFPPEIDELLAPGRVPLKASVILLGLSLAIRKRGQTPNTRTIWRGVN